jgi:hypothetical protein
MQLGAEHLHRLGPRAIAELLLEVGERGGCVDDMLDVLGRYRHGLTPELLRAVGGDRFPTRCLREAPHADCD